MYKRQAINDSNLLFDKPRSVLSINDNNDDKDRYHKRTSSTSRNFTCFKCGKMGHKANSCNLEKCFTCNKTGHVSKDCYKNAKCKLCHRIGHTENFCRQKMSNALISMSFTNKEKLNYVSATFNNLPIKMLVDMGAVFSVVSKNFVSNYSLENLCKTCNENAIVADGRQVKIDKYLQGTLCFDNFRKDISLYVVDTSVEAIMGMDLISVLGLRVGVQQNLIFSFLPDTVKAFSHIFDRPLKDSCLKGFIPLEIIRVSDESKQNKIP